MKVKDTKGCMLYDSIYEKCPRIAQSMETESRLVTVRRRGRREENEEGLGTRFPFEVMKLLRN